MGFHWPLVGSWSRLVLFHLRYDLQQLHHRSSLILNEIKKVDLHDNKSYHGTSQRFICCCTCAQLHASHFKVEAPTSSERAQSDRRKQQCKNYGNGKPGIQFVDGDVGFFKAIASCSQVKLGDEFRQHSRRLFTRRLPTAEGTSRINICQGFRKPNRDTIRCCCFD